MQRCISSIAAWLCGAALAVCAEAATMLSNTGFETLSPNGAPVSWSKRTAPDSVFHLTADGAVKFSGERALKLEVENAVKPRTFHAAFQRHDFAKPLAADCYGRLVVRAKGVDVSNGQITVDSVNSIPGQGGIWQCLARFNGSFDWKTESSFVLLPAGTSRLVFYIRMYGPGTLWVDDVSFECMEFAPAAVPPAISGSADFSAAWTERKYPGNENASAIRVEARDGGAVAVQQWLAGGPKSGFAVAVPQQFMLLKAFRASGRSWCDGAGRSQVGMEFFDNHGMPCGSCWDAESGEAAGGYRLRVLVPAGAVRGEVVLLNTGKGAVRFGDVTFEADDGAGASVAAAPALRVRAYPVDTSPEQLQVSEPEFNTFTDSPTKLTFHFAGDRARIKEPVFEIDLPAGLHVADAVYPHQPEGWRQEPFASRAVQRPEGAYRTWRFDRPQGMALAEPDFHYQRRLVMLLMPDEQGTVFNGRKAFYRMLNNGESLGEKSFSINLLPPMKATPNPKEFAFIRWNDEDLTFADEAAFLASIRCMEEAGYTWFTRYDPDVLPVHGKIREMLLKRGWTAATRGAHLSLYHVNSLSERAGQVLPRAVNSKGEIQKSPLCPSFVLFDSAAHAKLTEAAKAEIRRRRTRPGECVFLDNEEWSPMDWCFCDHCRKAFAEFAKLPAPPQTAEILERHRKAWRDFRVWLAGRHVQWCADIGRELGVRSMDYDYVFDYSQPDIRDSYFNVANDAQNQEQFHDGHLASFYHIHDARAFDMMRVSMDYLKKPFYPMCAVDGLCSYQVAHEVLTPARFRVTMLSAAINGCPGFAIYPGERLDGKFYLAADRAMAEIAACEAYFRKGAIVSPFKIAATGPNPAAFFRSQIRELDGARLVSLVNFNANTPLQVTIQLDRDAAAYAVTNPVTGEKLAANGRDIALELQPRDAAFVLVQ